MVDKKQYLRHTLSIEYKIVVRRADGKRSKKFGEIHSEDCTFNSAPFTEDDYDSATRSASEHIGETIDDAVKKAFESEKLKGVDFSSIPSEVIAMVPGEMARTYSVVPYARTQGDINTLYLACNAGSNAMNVLAGDDVKFLTGYNVELAQVDEKTLDKALDKYYPKPNENILSKIPKKVRQLLPDELVRKQRIIPYAQKGGAIYIATDKDAKDMALLSAIDDVKFLTGFNVETEQVDEQTLTKALDKYYKEPAGMQMGL